MFNLRFYKHALNLTQITIICHTANQFTKTDNSKLINNSNVLYI